MTSEQLKLLLILNFDTNKKQGLTLSQRCEIHQIIADRKKIEQFTLVKKIDELYLKIKAQNYKPVFYKWIENKNTASLEIEIDSDRTTWNYLNQN